MKKKRILLFLTGIFVLGILPLGCKSSDPPTPTGPPKEGMNRMKQSEDQAKQKK